MIETFKFKAWNKKIKKMICSRSKDYEINISLDGSLNVFFKNKKEDSNDYVLLKYVNFIDKKDNLLYIDDFIQLPDGRIGFFTECWDGQIVISLPTKKHSGAFEHIRKYVINIRNSKKLNVLKIGNFLEKPEMYKINSEVLNNRGLK
ncbi:MAG: hypothetical protein ACTSQG_00310 [Promethearchaeota archaeon]